MIGRPMSTATDDRVAAAVADLATRLGVPAAEVVVQVLEEVTWSDGSLGCPVPGLVYPQMLVPGARLVLEAAGSRYEYHATADGPFGYCADPRPPVRGGRVLR